MSTAIMPQNAMYDFGDNLIKNGIGDTAPGAHLGVSSAAMRLTLSRMASTPTTNTAANNATTNLAVILGNLSQQQQQQQHHRRLERTQSAPAPATTVAASVNTSRYKTELCRPYEEFGVCKYGDKCQFAHGGAELRSLARHPKYKTELCRTYHTVGFCPYGPRCHFVHNQDEVLQRTPLMAVKNNTQQNVSTTTLRPRPAALSPALSLDSPSPPCSLSQSPTSSMGSFFSSEPELHSPSASSTGGSLDEQRLPVFNRLSAVHILSLSDLML